MRKNYRRMAGIAKLRVGVQMAEIVAVTAGRWW